MAVLLKSLTVRGLVGERFRGLALLSLVLVFPLMPLPLCHVPSLQAQSPGVNGIIYSNQPSFRIPFEMEPGAGRFQEIQLWVSEDQGQNWRQAGTAMQEQRGFDYRADRDGKYWFTVRTIDALNRAVPLTLQGTKPQLKVYIDTRKPLVSLRSRPARDGQVAVEWDIQEENLDPANFYLDYRVAGTPNWIPLIVDPSLSGDRAWNPGTSGAVEVRLRVRDLARNEGGAQISLTPGGNNFSPSSNSYDADGRRDSYVTAPGRRYVNNKRLSLNYGVKEAGPSGVSLVELWQTQDARTWQKVSEDRDARPPFVHEVPGEGLYGFTLIPRSGVGLSDPPPRIGDRPQIWVEVDITPPVVFWVQADVGRGQDAGKMTITWKATDKNDNLAREPITISYSEQLDGKWTQIVSSYANDGRYVWTMPAAGIPYKFYVRVEAVDKAGNVGSKETVSQVIVDLAQPKSEILEVGPAPKQGPFSGKP